MSITRRDFLGQSTGAVFGAAALAAGKKAYAANERIGIACVGVRSRGLAHCTHFAKNAGSEVVAICDVDATVVEVVAGQVERLQGKKPKTYVDMRDAFADPDVHAVSFATPNHWHSLGAIWACQAGKDVYVEKPISHTVWEGRQVVAAAQKYGRIVAHGTQSRSDATKIRSMERLHSGVIGDIYMARALCFNRRDSIGIKADCPPPPELDWNLWQGPAPERPFNPNYVHYNWHWFWNYGNGDIGNQGVHQMDLAVWGIGKGLPSRVYSVGGRFAYGDQGESPNAQVATFTYADGTMLVFEVRALGTNAEQGERIGNLFYGSKGYMVGVKTFDTDNKDLPDDTPIEQKGDPADSHFENFVEAVRTRKPELLRATAPDGHIAAAHCHLANISYRLKREIHFDSATESCPNDAEANALLRGEYRKGFEVPEIV